MSQRAAPIIADRAEFVGVLSRMRLGLTLVRPGDETGPCVLDGALVRHAYTPLADYGLIDEVPQPAHLPHAHCYRLSERGREFADRAWASWRQRPLWQRLVVQLTG
jgi:hypothetical protein